MNNEWLDRKPDLTLAGFDPYRHADGYYYDPTVIERIAKFSETHLCHVKGRWAGTPLILAPWQRLWLGNLFGWKHADGERKDLRRFRSTCLECGRKNAKTTTTSILAWHMLGCDGEQGAEILLAANSRDQAAKLWEVIEGQYHASKTLQKKFKLIPSRYRITYPTTNSYLQVMSAESSTAHGYSAHLAVMDELHGAANRKLYDALCSGFGARDQSILCVLSTAGHDETSIFGEVHDYMCRVRDDVLPDPDPTTLPAIFSLSKESDWTDEDNWLVANPNLPYGSPSLDFLRNEFKKARAVPAYENTFRNLYLCQWVAQQTRWLSVEMWDQCRGDYPADLDVSPCFAGLDLSTNNDVTAFVMSWMIDGVLHIVPHFFMPRDTAEKRETNLTVPWSIWAKRPENNLHVTEGDVIDYDYVTQTILDLAEKYNISTIYFDRYKHTSVTQRLAQQGLDLVAHAQDFAAMAAPCHELERLLLTQSLNHGGNEIARWMISNVEVKSDDGGRIRPVKPGYQNAKKIDFVSALLMSISGHLGDTPFMTATVAPPR